MRDKAKLVQELEVKVLSGEGSRNNQTQLFTGQFNCVQSGVADWLSHDPQIKRSIQNGCHDAHMWSSGNTDHKLSRVMHPIKNMRIDPHGKAAGTPNADVADVGVIKIDGVLQFALLLTSRKADGQHGFTSGGEREGLSIL